MFRIALAQMNSCVGDVRGNADRVLDFARRAHEKGADLVVFPELTLVGYPPEDLVFLPALVEANMRELDRIAREAPPTALVLGYLEPASGGRVFNSAAFVFGGKVHARYHKMKLPNFSVFDEQRYFQAGQGCPIVSYGGVRIAMTLCEDLWHDDGPVATTARAGARLIVSPNASPYSIGRIELRERMLHKLSLQNGVYVAYANLVGGQDELVFDGGSMVYGPDGSTLGRAEQFEEAILTVDMDLAHELAASTDVRIDAGPFGHGRASLPYQIASTLEVEPEVYKALVLATRDYARKNGFKDVVLGLSGGVDSSLVATIAADALGPAQVTGVMMPSRYSSEGSVSDAESLARLQGLKTETLPIEPAHAALLGTLETVLGEGAHGLTEENLQARIRGVLLMAVSNARGSLVLTTGNKSEIATGYSTLYGDTAGGFAVLKDVEKSLVFRLCRWRNSQQKRDVIPDWVIEKPPSAELRPGQRDTDSLPPYDVLDPIMRAYVEDDMPPPKIAALGYDLATVKKVVGMVDRNEYKRRQSPPGPRITQRSLGKDRRMPVTSKWRSEAGA